jgi:hypothetical protein
VSFDVAPVSVTSPDGTRYEPVRARTFVSYYADDVTLLELIDREGVSLIATKVTGQATMGRRNGVVECADGRWLIENPCGTCGARGRRLRQEWTYGESHPKAVGT